MPSLSAPLRLCGFVLAALVLMSGCGRANDQATGDANAGAMLRIVSLSPAISRTLIDLELDSHLVGRTPFCDAVDQSIPAVGDLLDLNLEMLVRLRPTHVLVQPPASGIDPALVKLAEERGWTIGAWHLDTIDDVRTMIADLPAVIAPEDDATHAALRNRAQELIERINRALQPADDIFRGSILLLVGIEPVTIFGHGTYLDEVLAALGGRNAATHQGYPQLSLEDITRMEPDAVVLIAPVRGEGAKNTRSVRERLGPIARLEIPAVRDGRLAVLDHPDSFLPSSGIIGVAAALRDILHVMARDEESKRQNGKTSKYFGAMCVAHCRTSGRKKVRPPCDETFGRSDVLIARQGSVRCGGFRRLKKAGPT